MARGGNNYLPKKLYYLKKLGEYYGPYTKKPTQMCNTANGDEIISWLMDNDGNYMIQTLKVIRKNKLKKINLQ